MGKLAVRQARKIIEANDQLLRLGGNAEALQSLRLGLSTPFLEKFLADQTSDSLSDIFIHADHSIEIAKGLIEGYIDVGCIFENSAFEAGIEDIVVNECSEPLVWVRARHFVLSPGAPVPILTWPGDDWTIRAMTRHGVSYKIAFNGGDHHAKLAALEAAIGLAVMPQSMVPANLVEAKEYYLPPLPSIKALLCAHPGLETERALLLMEQLSALFFQKAKPNWPIERKQPVSI